MARLPYNPSAVNDYFQAIYFLEREGRTHEFSFVAQSLPGAGRMNIEAPRPWAIVSACNPMSSKLSDAENAARQEELAGILREQGVQHGPAGGRNAEGSWTEPSIAVFGLTREEVLSLARRFEQRAVVWAGSDGVGLLDCNTERLVRRPIYGR